MNVSSKLGFALGLVLLASPAAAFTVAPAASTPNVRQFADPDDALEGTSSALRDAVVENNVRSEAPAGRVPWGYGGSTFGFSGPAYSSQPGNGFPQADQQVLEPAQGYGAPLVGFGRRPR